MTDDLSAEIARQLGGRQGSGEIAAYVQAWHRQLERACDDDEELAQLVEEREELASELPDPWAHVVANYPLDSDRGLDALTAVLRPVAELDEGDWPEGVFERLTGLQDGDEDSDAVLPAIERRYRNWRLREGVKLPDLPPEPERSGLDSDTWASANYRQIFDYLIEQTEMEENDALEDCT